MPAWGVNTFISIYGKCFALTPCGNIVIIVIFQKTKVLRFIYVRPKNIKRTPDDAGYGVMITSLPAKLNFLFRFQDRSELHPGDT